MKFYKYNDGSYFDNKIVNNKLTAIYLDYNVYFYKNGKMHNSKNAAYADYNNFKHFHLNGKFYGYEGTFTKESWRRFVKMQAFL